MKQLHSPQVFKVYLLLSQNEFLAIIFADLFLVCMYWFCHLSCEYFSDYTFYGPFSGTTRVSRCQKKSLLDFVVQGEISEADTLTIRLGATPSLLISDRPPSFPYFYAGCPSCTTLRIYTDLGQAPNMLACIPSGLVLSIPQSSWKSSHKFLSYPVHRDRQTNMGQNITPSSPLSEVVL